MALTRWLKSAALATALALTPATAMAKENLETKVRAAEVVKQKPVKKKPIIKDVTLQNPKRVSAPLEAIDLPDEKKVTYNTKWWEYMLYIPTTYFLAMALHESGHAAMYKVCGYKGIKINFFEFKNGAVSTTSALYPYRGYKPKKLEEAIIGGGGMMFTSLANVGLTTLLRSDAVPEKMRPFVATLSLMMMFDRYRYVISATGKYIFTPNKLDAGNDIHSIITTLNGSKRGNDIGYAVWAGLTALEIGLRYPEIKYLVHTAIGRKETMEKRYIQVHAYPIQSGGMFGVSGEF